ncbi:MAG: cell division protein FtsA [Lentisphaerae bacterium]|nr:cell division protein FtsA [Lentisphaerota bacterium]
MANAPVVGLEIGTTKVIALVGELRDDGVIMITGIGERPSTGVRKGEIIDIENAALCVKSVLAMAEERSNVAIREVLLAVSGGHVQGLVNRGTVPVFDKDGEISREDLDEVMEVAKAVNLPPEREILHTISQYYYIDNDQRVINPEGMQGAQLSVDMLVIHGVRNRLNNTVRVVRNIPVDVHDVAASGLCSALSVLTAEQKKSGVVVIDLGGGKTDYVVYADGVVASAGVLGVGGDHVTNDIALGFSIPTAQAEVLKRESGSVNAKAAVRVPTVTLPAEGGFPGRTLAVRSLNLIMHARMDEVLAMIKRRLEKDDVLHQVGAGVVLTGGGAHMAGIVELAEAVFGLPCAIGKPRNVSGLAAAMSGPEYATVSGLVQYGFKTVKEQARPPLSGWLGRIFSR